MRCCLPRDRGVPNRVITDLGVLDVTGGLALIETGPGVTAEQITSCTDDSVRVACYTGRQVWNRQRKDEVLLSVDDVGLEHTTKLRWNSDEEWVWSDEVAHPPIVSTGDFTAAQEVLRGRGGRHTDQTRKRTPRPCGLSLRLVFHADKRTFSTLTPPRPGLCP